MSDTINDDTSAGIRKSISSIYSSFLNRRREEKEAKEERKQEEKNLKLLDEDGEKISKKEKRELDLNSWKTIIVGLTGEDLDYISTKKSKKKYKKWINDDLETSGIITDTIPKKKKRNYNKEFEPEINMLKSIVSDQNKFTADLLRRYQNAAGPNNKSAMPLNKTLVELASVINNSRSNSLGILREIGNLKKTIADLYIKQRREDKELGADGFNTQDLGLLGSDIARTTLEVANNYISTPNNIDSSLVNNPSNNNTNSFIEKFDPSSWTGNGIDTGSTFFETIPHTIIVEWYKNDNKARYLAIRNDNGEELIGCPVPTSKVKSINETNMTATDDFDQVYTLKIIE
jgi:hypothetical protein